MNKKIFLIILIIITMLCVNVKAEIKENAFINGKCLTTNTWKKAVRTEYQLNDKTEKYEIYGDSYSDATSSSENSNYIFYAASDNGDALYAFVPEYNKIKTDENAKMELLENGILITEDCSGTYAVVKTMIGRFDKSEENEVTKYNALDDEDDSGIKLTLPDTGLSFQIVTLIVGIVILLLLLVLILGKYNVLSKWREKK